MTTCATTTAELLAPAGDWEALRAAAANGATAVYFGLSSFSARHRATNFTLDELPTVLDFLHQRNVRGYVALNTLIFSGELEEIAATVERVCAAGADAVIVQDFGLARLIRRLAPELPIHASTQTTLTEPLGIELARSVGMERVILARELSIDEITEIGQQTDMPLEVFVHGALCVAYSGQCLTSEALGGRSANRGQCAQACRLPYELVVDGTVRDLGEQAYLLSPLDLSAHHLVPELLKAGVVSLKIEGRLKTAQYVAITTQTYREALDCAERGERFVASRSQLIDLSQSFSRGFSAGFLPGPNHQTLVPGRFPKARGVFVGKVLHTTTNGAAIELDSGHDASILKPGDGVVFDQGHPEQDEQGGRLYGVRPLNALAGNGSRAIRLEMIFGEGAINYAAITPGSRVWRTDDPALRKRAEQSYVRDLAKHHQPLDITVRGHNGGPLEVIGRVGNDVHAQVEWAGPLQIANKHPLAEETVREQFGRLGDTPFELGEVTLDLPDSVMVPKSVLNQLRRELVSQLLAADRRFGRPIHRNALVDLRREAAVSIKSDPTTTSQLTVLVRTQEQLAAVLERASKSSQPPAMVYCDFEDIRRYGEAVEQARDAGVKIGLATLRVLKLSEAGLMHKIVQCEPDAVLCRNLGSIAFCREHAPHLELVGDFSLNVANELTADWMLSLGLSRVVPSYDLNWQQLAALLGRAPTDRFELVVHQHMPMFHMEHCVFAATLSTGKDFRDCGRPCDRHRVELRDRVGAAFPLVADTGCRNTVFNSVAQSAAEYANRMQQLGARWFRVELLRETRPESLELISRYQRVLSGEDDGRSAWRGLQVIQQLGVTRGTLAG